VTPSPSRTAHSLALTGSNLSLLGGVGLGMVVLGMVLAAVAWRSRRLESDA
jgi:hypothetical protein